MSVAIEKTEISKTDNIIVLASVSPRRIEILKRLEIPFITKPQNIDETVTNWKLPESVKKLAEKKSKKRSSR
jgi:predicted house-cleaning NTP pyrophosphatase (Maf/HAM1 superfamily)